MDEDRYQAPVPDDWLVDTVRARLLPTYQEMVLQKITLDQAGGRTMMTYDGMKKYLLTYERERIPDANYRRTSGGGDSRQTEGGSNQRPRGN